MKIKDILTESRIDNLSKEEFQKLLETDYSQAYEQFKRGNVLYRGFGSMEIAYNRLQPMRGRESINTNNFYTLIMNNDPRFREFPKRSVIVSSNRNTAISFSSDDSTSAIIFPKNGARIGMCNAPDIWRAKPVEVQAKGFAFYEIGRMIAKLYKWLGTSPAIITEYEEMLEMQKKFEQMKKEDSDEFVLAMSHYKNHLESYNLQHALIEDLIEKGPKGLYELINTSPFTLFDVSNMKPKENNELWFDDEYLAISLSLAKKMFGDQ
jgi:hypothetical protein